MACIEMVPLRVGGGACAIHGASRGVVQLACSLACGRILGCPAATAPGPANRGGQQGATQRCTRCQASGLQHLHAAAAAAGRLALLPELQPLRPSQPLRTCVSAPQPHHMAPLVCRGISRGRRPLCTQASCLPPASLAAGGDLHVEPPIIVTASWLGAKRRPFSKYKQLWQSLGYKRVLSARPPMSSIMFPLQGQLLAASFTHRLLAAAAEAPGAPVLVHLFSGGGFIFMGWVFQLLAELGSPEAEALRGRIAGVVLDSSPAAVTPDVSSRALVAAALGRPADGIEAAFPWLVRPAAALVDGYLRLPFVRDALVGMDDAWARAAPPCPQLFLYSDADALIQPRVVEAFMAAQAARGAPTYAHRWADSAHVDHYRAHPEEYARQVGAFARRALQAWALRRAGGGGSDGTDGSGELGV